MPGDSTVDNPSFSDTTVDSTPGPDTTRDSGPGADATVDGSGDGSGSGSGDATVDGAGGGDATVDTTTSLVDSTVDTGGVGVPLHGNCSSANCATGLICVSFDSAQPPVCLQDCTNSASVCASNSDGRTTCFAINSTTSTCVQTIATNGNCNPQMSKICGTTGDGCTNGICQPLPRANRFEPCAGNTGKVCDPSTQVCVNVSDGLTHGYCFDTCNSGTTACTTNGVAGSCVALTTSGGACVPNGTSAQDTVCGQDEGQNWSASKQCGASLTCLTFNAGDVKGLCLPSVTSCTGANCGTGRTCVPLTSGAGVCAQDCTASAAVCTNAGKNCSALSATLSVCSPAGTRTFSQTCSASTLCAPNLTCLSETAQSPTGYCTPPCDTSTPCPTTPAGASCLQISATSNLCVFDCTSSPSICPSGLTCKTIGATNLCLP